VTKPLPLVCEDCEWYRYQTDYDSPDGVREICTVRGDADRPENCPTNDEKEET